MTRFEGRVALVTGAARGQGRSHAVRLASEGADIIALDICDDIKSIPYPLATKSDLEETEAGEGGSIILISSTAGLAGAGGNTPGGLGYTASKHGVIGLMRAYANYLAPDNIRVNALLPTGVYTPMILNDVVQEYIRSDPQMSGTNALPVSALEPEDVANAVAWLASDEAKFVAGVALPVDAGYLNKR